MTLPRTRYRTQVQAAHLLMLIAAYLAWPTPKPLLWPMFDWMSVSINPLIWASVFGAVGLWLSRTHSARQGMIGMGIAAALFVVIGISAYGALGLNVAVLFAGVKAVHCVWTAIDLKAAYHQQRGTRNGGA